jgi:hypothetical protein
VVKIGAEDNKRLGEAARDIERVLARKVSQRFSQK